MPFLLNVFIISYYFFIRGLNYITALKRSFTRGLSYFRVLGIKTSLIKGHCLVFKLQYQTIHLNSILASLSTAWIIRLSFKKTSSRFYCGLHTHTTHSNIHVWTWRRGLQWSVDQRVWNVAWIALPSWGCKFSCRVPLPDSIFPSDRKHLPLP